MLRTCCLIIFICFCITIIIVYFLYFFNTIRIVAIGDSLINKAEIEFGLLDQIYDQILVASQPHKVRIINAGVDSDTIADIHRRLWSSCYIYFPHAIVLFWDSDVSNYEESLMTIEEIKVHRENYRNMLGKVLDRLKEHSEYVLVTGPTLYGELTRGTNAKDGMVEDYLSMNVNATLIRGIEYLDSRSVLMDALPVGWGLQNDTDFVVVDGLGGGYFSIDGEHLNLRGSQIVARLISERLINWLTPARGGKF